ncbi:MAG: co-chaperone YbbN [Propionibacterium sp.]|nr:MAG: co-chaperone YbbN [Propionibacterium sp.]
MSSASFGNSIDFSTLASNVSAGSSWVVDVDESVLESLIQKSMQHPVILEITSSRAQGSAEFSKLLDELANNAAGKFLLGRIDVDAQPKLAQALKVQAVPMVVALLAGQLAPLFQGTAAKEDVSTAIDQVLQAAAANGIMGRAEPVANTNNDGNDSQPATDPRFEAADQALASGDYSKAVSEFDKLLAETPNDSAAIAGRAQAALLQRSLSFDPEAITAKAASNPNDIGCQLDAADLDIIKGDYTASFQRLLDLIAQLAAEDREEVRLRLLELFEIVGATHPEVLKARRKLSGLLF